VAKVARPPPRECPVIVSITPYVLASFITSSTKRYWGEFNPNACPKLSRQSRISFVPEKANINLLFGLLYNTAVKPPLFQSFINDQPAIDITDVS
jgi:hypothetical protein